MLNKYRYDNTMFGLRKSYMLAFGAGIITFLFILGLTSIDRSVRMDEVTLWVNIYNLNFIDLFSPLPYYTQASTPVYSIIYKTLLVFFESNFPLIRLILLSISCSFIIFYLYILKKQINSIIWLFILLVNSFNFLYFSTEFKHYSFEFIASLLSIISFYYYFKENYKKGFFYFTAALFLGFSSIIPAGTLLLYLLFQYHNKTEKKYLLKYILASVFLLIVSFVTTKYLTSVQISSHDVYVSQGALENISIFFSTLDSVQSPYLTALVVFSLIYGIGCQHENKFYKTFCYLYLFLFFSVLLLKTLAIYPIFSKRHLFWFLPFSITLCSFFIQHFIAGKKIIKWVLFSILFYAICDDSYNFYRFDENIANKKLIAKVNELCELPNTNIISSEWADRVLFTYKDSLSEKCNLRKIPPHNDESAETYARFFTEKLSQYDEKMNNYLVLSHINVDKEIDLTTYIEPRQYLINESISYEEYFLDQHVAIYRLRKQLN